MIDFISGTLFTKEPLRVVINHQGIGIECLVPFSTTSHLPEKGKEITLLTYLHWRQEDSPQLFGFFTEDERDIFKILMSVNKVGPKLALNIMSAAEPETLATMILSEDVSKLTSLKGVGPKLASRLVIELKEKVAKLGIGQKDVIASAAENNNTIPYESEVKEALENLGYSPKEIANCIKRVAPLIAKDAEIEEVIGQILQQFN